MKFLNRWNNYHNPLYYWFKARKKFKRPKCKFIFGNPFWFYGFPLKIKPFIDIRFRSLIWKSKFDSPRFECCPYISITLFKKKRLLFLFVYGKDYMENIKTWEAILDYLYFNNN